MASSSATRTKEDFHEYLFDHFLPRWAKHGQEDNGAFLYILGPDWSPAANPERRTRVQARQTWVFSRAAALGAGDWASKVAERGHDYLLNTLQDKEHGGFHLMVTPDGQPIDRFRRYAQCGIKSKYADGNNFAISTLEDRLEISKRLRFVSCNAR